MSSAKNWSDSGSKWESSGAVVTLSGCSRMVGRRIGLRPVDASKVSGAAADPTVVAASSSSTTSASVTSITTTVTLSGAPWSSVSLTRRWVAWFASMFDASAWRMRSSAR